MALAKKKKKLTKKKTERSLDASLLQNDKEESFSSKMVASCGMFLLERERLDDVTLHWESCQGLPSLLKMPVLIAPSNPVIIKCYSLFHWLRAFGPKTFCTTA